MAQCHAELSNRIDMTLISDKPTRSREYFANHVRHR